jgi:glucose uptake protein GlcU
MWKSIIYKEWLKTRWFFIAFAALGTLVVGYIFLTVQHNFKFNEPNNYWYTLLFMKLKYFGYLKFAPIAGALAISIAQFFPETVDKRIKLTFHLPLNENKVLLIMTLFGTLCLLAAYLLFLALFVGLSTIYFPSNIILPALVTIAPWFLEVLPPTIL